MLRMLIVAAVLALAPLGAISAPAPKTETAKTHGQRLAATLRVVTDTGMGCGVIIEGGQVITAWHVVDGAKVIQVVDRMGHIRRGVHAIRLAGQDVALIALDKTFPAPGVPIAKRPVTVLAYVECLGYWGRGLRDGINLRLEGALYPDMAPHAQVIALVGGTLYCVAVPVGPGLSGSPLFLDGELIGVCSAGPRDGVGAGVTYWAKADRLSTTKPVPPVR